MKKVLFFGLLMLCASSIFAQTKAKSMREVRDSVFTSINLSDENRVKVHDLIQEISMAKAEVSKAADLTEEQKKEKLLELSNQQSKREQDIMTPEQRASWAKFAREYKRPRN
ncbi:hypothetical protein ACR777_06570 [Sphingobacterium spiritivorum]|uniref:hypothetical protein n=1 Tax=Sphingobacterium spiritivorum TaxID=258 RepID=UPI003DA1FFB3